MKRAAVLIALLPLMTAASGSDSRAVRAVLDQMIAGEMLPPEILDRQVGHPEFPDLDKAVSAVKGCKVSILEPLQNGSYGVQWRCKGVKTKDQPSAMIVYARNGQVTRITTAFVDSRY